MPGPHSSQPAPLSYFFSQVNGFTQSVAQSFGPVQGNEINEFRLTSRFTCGASAKAYSICKGIVLIQPQTGSADKVNLVLRPFRQPFPGLNIKYFVYRGLKKADFFTNTADPLVIAAVTNVTSEFVNKVNADFDNFYSEPLLNQNGTVIPKPAFSAKFLGYDASLPLTTLLSDLFFKEAQFTSPGQESSAFELPMIDEGKWLGSFNTGEGGIDVVLDYGDYQHDFDNGDFVFNLNYARASEFKIILTGTDLEKKLLREQTTQFIDAAAFYGLFVRNGKVKAFNNGVITEKSGLAIYTDLLTPFVTKNTWYLYIQGDRTRSYDFYKEYAISDTGADNLKTGITENALNNAQYQTYGWPLLVNTQQSTPVAASNNLYLQLVTDNNVDAALYVHVGEIGNAQQNNFCNADNLRMPPDANGSFGNLTRKLQLSIPAAADGRNIAGITLLLYEGISYSYYAGQMQISSSQTIDLYLQPNFFDDIFDLIKSSSLLISTAGATEAKMTSLKPQLINHYHDKRQQGISAVQTLTVNDAINTDDINNPELLRVTYLTEAFDIMTDTVAPTGAITPNTKTSGSASKKTGESKTYGLTDPYYFEIKFFTENEVTIKGLELKTSDGTTPAKIVLGLTKDENDQLKALITAGRRNPRLFLMDLFADGINLLSVENIPYQKYKVGLVAEVGDALQLFMPATAVYVYSLDRNYHFSELYSRHMQEIKEVMENQIINNVEQ